MEDTKRPSWSSYISFIIAAIGSAVGLGNIWRFPYVTGKYGGAVFLLTYLLIILFICAIPLCLELALGKFFKKDTITCYEKISPKLKWFGQLNLITAILIPAFYFVVGGWIINYIWIFLTNNIPSDFSVYFSELNSSPYQPIILTFLFLFIVAIFPYRGVNKGIEKANNFMMPTLAVALILLAIVAISLPGAKEGLEFMFKPDFSKFSEELILTALGQALFTLSIGMGAMVTYGSYLNKDVNIKKSAYTLIFFDTLVSILAGVMIFPVVFTYGIEPTAGASLAFISLPQIFLNMPFSIPCAILFFLLLFFAAVTSGISLMETSTACFIDNFKISRKKAVVILTLIIGILSIPSALSFGALENFKIFGKTIFDSLDFVTSTILLPFNTLIICIICGWFASEIAKEAFGEGKFAGLLKFLLRYILPLVFAYALIVGL